MTRSAPPRRRIHIGEVAASAEALVVTTLLGSCVAVCLFDAVSETGGMNHILLPGSCAQTRSARFGLQAMEMLINDLMRLGADRRRFVAKAFGGANVIPGFQSPTVGDRNNQFVREFLAAEKIPLVAQRLGGCHAVQVNFHTGTGKANVCSTDGSRLQRIVRDEDSYCSTHLADSFFTGEATIF
jgi:chemotaxis protein CheD